MNEHTTRQLGSCLVCCLLVVSGTDVLGFQTHSLFTEGEGERKKYPVYARVVKGEQVFVLLSLTCSADGYFLNN